MTLKNIKEKEPIVNEKINLDSTRIDKLEGIITNLGTVFSSVKNTPSPPAKIAKLIYVPKNKSESSSKETADCWKYALEAIINGYYYISLFMVIVYCSCYNCVIRKS